jgi:hypothetical protein
MGTISDRGRGRDAHAYTGRTCSLTVIDSATLEVRHTVQSGATVHIANEDDTLMTAIDLKERKIVAESPSASSPKVSS